MANRGSKKKIPMTIKEVSIVTRIILYVLTAAAIVGCVLSLVYSVHKVGLMNKGVDAEYLLANIDTDTTYMFEYRMDINSLKELVIDNSKEYIKFTTIVYIKYAIQYAIAAIMLIGLIVFLDLDNLKNPFTKKSTRIVNTLIGCSMCLFFLNIGFIIKVGIDCPHFVNLINSFVLPILYCLITFGLLIFNYCLRTGMNMLKEGK